MLLHCVFMRFKASLTSDDKQEIYHRVSELQRLLPGVLDVKYGPNISFQGLHGGFHDGFIVTLEDDAALDGFVTHPLHEELNEALLDHSDGGLSGILVFDMAYQEA
jgi:hypothetical protein